MTPEDFNKLASTIYQASATTLNKKAGEYSKESDRLANFKRAGAFENCCPEKALRGMLTKHMVSIYDMIDEIQDGKPDRPLEIWDEKVIDAINYFILLRALIAEKDCGLKNQTKKYSLVPGFYSYATGGPGRDGGLVEEIKPGQFIEVPT